MKKISLTLGKQALVDDIDYPVLMAWKWRAVKGRHTYYAVHSQRIGKRTFHIKMHRLLLGDKDNIIDHKDGNGLNNQRKNLRECTYQQNKANSQHIKSKSGYKGVFPRNGSWVSVIKVNYIPRYLGIFKDKMDAVKAYAKASKKYFGEFARS